MKRSSITGGVLSAALLATVALAAQPAAAGAGATTPPLRHSVAAVTGAGAPVAVTAPADWVSDFKEPGVRIRSGPYLTSSVRGLGYPGDGATITQVVRGSYVSCPAGGGTSEWYLLTDRRTGVWGYSSLCYVY